MYIDVIVVIRIPGSVVAMSRQLNLFRNIVQPRLFQNSRSNNYQQFMDQFAHLHPYLPKATLKEYRHKLCHHVGGGQT